MEPIKFAEIFGEDKGRRATMPEYLRSIFNTKERFYSFIDGLSDERYKPLQEAFDLIERMGIEIKVKENWHKTRGTIYDKVEDIVKRQEAERKIRASIENYLKPKKETKIADPALTTYDPVLDATPNFNWADKAFFKTMEYGVAKPVEFLGKSLEACFKGIGILK
ncbi:MAG: hypothetical protein KAT77_05905 [Nanoarchaeota archaeon]|nr:hypothetical protein [Nanoarchaeota archaeon]